MPGNGPNGLDDFKARVLDAVNIVDLIGQTVSLKRRGKDFVGLCPFHQEKSPSFHVSPSKQFFHCYGCKAGGNAIDFVIKRDRVVFIDALRSLGQSVGMELPQRGGSREKTGERQQLLDACSAACGLFEKLLSHPEMGLAARNYLEQRGFDSESVKRFQIGFAPDAWDTLLKSAVARKFPPALLSLAGLLKPRSSGDGFYDTFRNRVIFPIRDDNGRVIAFGGRVMPGSEDPAKYLNSPETPLFSKSRCIFGLDLARQRIVEKQFVAVVEGYTDVVMAHQHGVSNVVSILGTAMTEQHVSILKRFADRIVLLFDPDTAGELAVNRAVEIFLTQPIEIAIATMPDGGDSGGSDPDEYLIENGPEAFEKVLSGASDALTFKWKQLDRRFHASNDLTGKQKAVSEYLELLASARGSGPVDSIRWGQALARVSRLTEVPLEELHRRFKAKKVVGPVKPRPAANAAQVSDGHEPTNSSPVVRGLPSAQEIAERRILGVVLSEPERWQDVQQVVDLSDFTDAARQRLAGEIWAGQRDEGEQVFNQFLSRLEEQDLKELAVELVDDVAELKGLDDAINDAVLHLKDARRRREERAAHAEMRSAVDEQDEKRRTEIEVSLLATIQQHARRPDLRRT